MRPPERPPSSGAAAVVSALHREAAQALNRRDWPRTQHLCLRVLQLDPAHAAAHFLLGIALAERRQPAAALARLREAARLQPANAEFRTQLARWLSSFQRLDEAAQAARQALALQPQRALSLDTIGVVLSRAGDHAEAARAFGRATELEPGNAGFQFNLASSLKFLGRFDEAERAYERCLAAEPHFWRAHSALAQLRRQTPERNHLARLLALLPVAAGNPDACLHLHHALAKTHEDLGEYEQAFSHLTQGKSLKRAQLGYTFEQDRVIFDALRTLDAPPTGAGHADESPIFVIGMPRTGTTLVDRILSSHPQVRSAGELQSFARALKRLSGTNSRRLLDPETVEAARRIDPAELGRQYLVHARALCAASPRFVDKMPLNFLYAGFIAAALPRARIVCLRRNPLDTCLSNFRQLFALEYSYYNYAYDLLDTGRYFVEFDRLMQHWQQVLPGRIHEIHYEHLLGRQEAATRALLDFCGLDWDPACLRFERNEAPVSTASAVQVRTGLHDGALERWRHYAAHLQPLAALLRTEGVAVTAAS